MLGLMQQTTAADLVAAHPCGAASRQRRGGLGDRRGQHARMHLGRDRAPRAAAGARAARARRRSRRTASAHSPGTTTGISRSTTPTSGMQAICHTINPRLAPDDIAYIINDAGDSVLFVDPGFAPLIGGIARADQGQRARRGDDDRRSRHAGAGAAGRDAPALLRRADGRGGRGLRLAGFDENTASALCYTSGTTGRPKGVLYSHRSTVLHAYAIALPDVLDLRATTRILPVVPMFHVNAWGMPYATRADRRGAGAAGAASRRRQPGPAAQPGARDDDLRRADRLARPAAAPARQRREAGDGASGS